jgi:hypothetical protein
VEAGSLHPTSDQYFATCLLRDHMVEDECIAYRDVRKARDLLMDRD